MMIQNGNRSDYWNFCQTTQQGQTGAKNVTMQSAREIPNLRMQLETDIH